MTVQGFQQTTRQIRTELTSAITYTDLRKLATRRELESRLENHLPRMEGLVDECFDVWLQERHKSAERYLFPDAIETMRAIRSRHPDLCMAAITNGRGNPLFMENTTSGYFDFCVSGEDSNIFPQAPQWHLQGRVGSVSPIVPSPPRQQSHLVSCG